MALTKAQILAARDITTEEVPTPEWGGMTLIRVMSGTERDAFEASMVADAKTGRQNMQNFRARVAAICICDESGDRLFTDAEVNDLGKRSAKVLNRIVEAALKLNAFRDSDVKELVGNSEADPNAARGSGSPVNAA